MTSLVRLARDLTRLDVHDGVSAAPVGDDLHRWHGYIQLPHGGTAHFELQFDELYPTSPPTMRLLGAGPLRHFCVEEDTGIVHASLLTEHGWSSAYDLSSVLVSLQSFVSDEALHHNPEFVWGPLQGEQDYVCATCGHSASTPFPPPKSALTSCSRRNCPAEWLDQDWLPVFINKEHFRIEVLEEQAAKMLRLPSHKVLFRHDRPDEGSDPKLGASAWHAFGLHPWMG